MWRWMLNLGIGAVADYCSLLRKLQLSLDTLARIHQLWENSQAKRERKLDL
jgi:hypothetical protein